MPPLPEPVFTVYRTTCLVNGKIYIGVHKTRIPNDDYLGSGNLITAAVKKHGRDQFSKEVLFTFDTRAEAYQKERELVHAAFVKRADTYNLRVGGVESPGWYRSREGKLNSQHGTIWVWREGQKALKIQRPDLSQYLASGWVRGRGPQFKQRMASADNSRGGVNQGLVAVHKPDLGSRFVRPEAVGDLLAQGWQEGRGSCPMSSEHYRAVASALRQRLTGKPSTIRGRVLVHRGSEEKFVPPDQVQAFLLQGYKRGSTSSRKRSGGRNGGRNPALTWPQVRKIRSLWPGVSQTKLATQFETTQANISLIVRGKTWIEPGNPK